MNVGDRVEHDGFVYVVKAVKKGRVVLGDPAGERETIAVKVSALALGGGVSAEREARESSPETEVRTPKKRKAERSEKASPSASRAERNVVSGLGAVLVAETEDDGQTWVCPPMDVTMIASHLKLLHGIELGGLEMTEDEMLEHHQALHDAPFSEPKIRHRHEASN